MFASRAKKVKSSIGGKVGSHHVEKEEEAADAELNEDDLKYLNQDWLPSQIRKADMDKHLQECRSKVQAGLPLTAEDAAGILNMRLGGGSMTEASDNDDDLWISVQVSRINALMTPFGSEVQSLTTSGRMADDDDHDDDDNMEVDVTLCIETLSNLLKPVKVETSWWSMMYYRVLMKS